MANCHNHLVTKGYMHLVTEGHMTNRGDYQVMVHISNDGEIFDFLQVFKAVGEQLSSEKYVTISCIIPTYDYLLKHVINRDSKETPMIREMKTHMRAKLENRYSEDDQIFS